MVSTEKKKLDNIPNNNKNNKFPPTPLQPQEDSPSKLQAHSLLPGNYNGFPSTTVSHNALATKRHVYSSKNKQTVENTG
eukprot:jgi/Psemu1/57304/gm1.57304_g